MEPWPKENAVGAGYGCRSQVESMIETKFESMDTGAW